MITQNSIKTDLKEAVAHHFSEHADDWKIIYDRDQDRIDGFYSMNMIGRKDAVLRLLDGYAAGRSLKILDAGCGPGVFLREMLEHGHSVTGMDISEKMLLRAQAAVAPYGDRVRCIQGDIERMPFADSSYDAILCVGVLSYLDSDRLAVSELGRVVKDGGLVIVALPNLLRLNVWFDPYYYLNRGLKYVYQRAAGMREASPAVSGPGKKSPAASDAVMRKYRYNQLTGIFTENNLAKSGCVGIGYGPLTFWKKEIFSKKLSLGFSGHLEKLALRWGLGFATVFANHWVIALKKE